MNAGSIKNSKGEKLVEARLAEMIFSKKLKPGSKLIERDLAAILGVSRIPVREAIGRLIARGILLQDEKNRSVRVRNYTDDEIVNLYELREALETTAARLACERATKQDLAAMAEATDTMESEIGNYRSVIWGRADYKFHETMVAASKNDRIIHSFHLLISECEFVFDFNQKFKSEQLPTEEWVRKHMREVVNGHREILLLISNGEATAVEAVIRSHMRSSADREIHSTKRDRDLVG